MCCPVYCVLCRDDGGGGGSGCGGGGAENGDDWIGGTARSLMGRMLGSGMLERQRVWSKARSRKVREREREAQKDKERYINRDQPFSRRSSL